MCNDSGGVVDDVLVYRVKTILYSIERGEYRKDIEWISKILRKRYDEGFVGVTAQLALQGEIP